MAPTSESAREEDSEAMVSVLEEALQSNQQEIKEEERAPPMGSPVEGGGGH